MRSPVPFVISFILASVISSNASAQGIRGHINDDKGESLSYATVYIREAKMGTATNLKGDYELSLAPGTYTITYQYLGYTPVSYVVVINNDFLVKNITLTQQVFEIPEIVVKASDKDRAVYIMRKAIGMAPYHLNQVKSYKAEVYIKGGWGINRMPKMLSRQMNAKANQTAIKEGDYYFTESVNLITFNSPDKYVHEVISSRSTMPFNESGTSPMDFIQASFYQPVLVDMAISPLSPNAFANYSFKFMGATRQGDYIINKIQVIPKRESQQLFSGFIFIVNDDWAIQSVDLSNKNMAGIVKVRELYMPVEDKLWMPVSYEFNMDISLIGIKAVADYTSSVKYTEVETEKNLTASQSDTSLIKEAADAGREKNLNEIETILAKDKLSSADMVRLSKLNGKTTKSKEKEPLEVVDKTKKIIDPGASKKDSAYWEHVRPIPLTEAEKQSVIKNNLNDSVRKGSNTLSISLGSQKKSKEGTKKKPDRRLLFAKAVLMGRRWEIDKNNSLDFDGLAKLRSFSFNTVDGFTAGTGFTWFCKTGETSRLTVNPVARYAFNRREFMWSINSGFNFNSLKRSYLSLRIGSTSRDFTSSGVNPLLNTYSSLVFRYNWMKLYDSRFANVSFRTEIVNGLRLGVTGSWEKRGVLENTTGFSFFRPHREYTPNLLPNPFAAGEVDGYEAMTPVNHSNLAFIAELSYTLRQRYKMSEKVKVNLDSDYPTFHIMWKHGYNYNDTLKGNYDLLKGDISMHRSLGAMRQFRWSIGGGAFFEKQNLRLQDMYFFNTKSSAVLLNNYEDAFYLKPDYSISSPSRFAEGHIRYTTPCLLLKRLPLLSRTLIRENLSGSWLWTPEYGHYYEAGYSLSEIYLFAEAGFYAGFRDRSFDSAGFRIIFIIN